MRTLFARLGRRSGWTWAGLGLALATASGDQPEQSYWQLSLGLGGW